jgi:hypothetical protein
VARRSLATPAFAVAIACGCGGSPSLPPSGDAPLAVDAPSGPLVSGRLFELVAQNTAAFQAELGTQPYAEGRVAMTAVLLDSGAILHPAVAGDGLFAFPRATADERYQVTFTIDGSGVPHTFESSAASLTLDRLQIGREDRVPVPVNTNVTLQLTGFGSADELDVDSTGLWTETQRTPTIGSGSATATFDWSSQSSLFGPVGLLDASRGDELVAVELGNILLHEPASPYASLQGAAVLQPTLVGGGSQTLTGAMSSLPLRCTTLTVSPVELAAQLVAALGSNAGSAAYGTPTDAWHVLAGQGSGTGAGGALQLARFTETGTLTDATNAIQFADPFGAQLLAEGTVSAPRTDLGSAFSGDASAVVPITGTGCPAASQTVVPGGMPMSSPPRVATRPDANGRVAVTWDPAGSGSADEWIVDMFDVTDPPALTPVAAIVTATPGTSFDASLCTPGRSYMLELVTVAGVPDAGAGDFTQLVYPFTEAVTWSAPFQIESM